MLKHKQIHLLLLRFKAVQLLYKLIEIFMLPFCSYYKVSVAVSLVQDLDDCIALFVIL